MNRIRLAPLALAALVAAPLAQAVPDLIAVGSISGTYQDLSGTSTALENGVAGNRLGGIGSSLSWAGDATEHTFYLSNDNDYLASVADSNAVTVDKPNQLFVFDFTDAYLPGFVLQPVKTPSGDECSTSDQGGGGVHHIF